MGEEKRDWAGWGLCSGQRDRLIWTAYVKKFTRVEGCRLLIWFYFTWCA